MLLIPMLAKPKARPVVTKNGTFMPQDYTDWKEAVGWALKEQNIRADKFEGNLRMNVTFRSDDFLVQLTPIDSKRPKHVRGDIDNLCGGFMDAAQEYGIFKDDKQIIDLRAGME